MITMKGGRQRDWGSKEWIKYEKWEKRDGEEGKKNQDWLPTMYE